jgi:hypothetical protein
VSIRYHIPYPKTYAEAFNWLHRAYRQSVLLHDDLTLQFVKDGVAVYYGTLRIVLFHRDGRRVIYRAAAAKDETPNEAAVAHIARFLPRGFHVKHCGRTMLLHYPTGRTVAGTRQQIVFPRPSAP